MSNSEDSQSLTRRTFIRRTSHTLAALPLVSFIGCERHRYIRPAAELDLGPVEDLLYTNVHIRSKAILLFRDVDGWSGLSMRCTYRGCDLTFQEPVLLCPCCRTRYSMEGVPYPNQTAVHPLPWVDLTFKEGHLFANPGNPRPKSWRFTTPEIEEAVRKLRKRVKDEGLTDEVKIPEILTGKGTNNPGGMFLEDDPNLLHELDMIR